MSSLEQLLYGISQLFLGPVLLAVLILFGYAFWKGMSCCWLTPETPA